MKRLAACVAAAALAASAQAQPSGGPGAGEPRRANAYANPSAAIAAEIAFARLVQEKGQWTAFKATADRDAVMVTPRVVLAHQWLKDRPNPPVALTWQPHQVWSSCDGSLMVTHGAWQRSNGKRGWFTTVWRRQEKGGYKWTFDHGDESRDAVGAPEMISAQVAECPPRQARGRPAGPPPRGRGKPADRPPPPPPLDPARHEGRSNDGSLTWRVAVAADGSRDFVAQMLIDGRMQEIRSEHVSGE